MDEKTLDVLAAAVAQSPVVQRGWRVLESVLGSLDTTHVVIERNPKFWVPREDYLRYYTKTILGAPVFNAAGEVASRSCLLSFLSAVRAGRAGSRGVYASIGEYYRHEPVVTPGMRELVFPQLEIEVLDQDPEKALGMTLDILRDVLRGMECAEHEIRIQGTLPPWILDRPEVRYAGVDRHWKHYKTKKNVGFEAYLTGSEDALAGGGDFSELAHRFGLNKCLSAVGFGLGLLRLA